MVLNVIVGIFIGIIIFFFKSLHPKNKNKLIVNK